MLLGSRLQPGPTVKSLLKQAQIRTQAELKVKRNPEA
jgi:hypothetical protein